MKTKDEIIEKWQKEIDKLEISINKLPDEQTTKHAGRKIMQLSILQFINDIKNL